MNVADDDTIIPLSWDGKIQEGVIGHCIDYLIPLTSVRSAHRSAMWGLAGEAGEIMTGKSLSNICVLFYCRTGTIPYNCKPYFFKRIIEGILSDSSEIDTKDQRVKDDRTLCVNSSKVTDKK